MSPQEALEAVQKQHSTEFGSFLLAPAPNAPLYVITYWYSATINAAIERKFAHLAPAEKIRALLDFSEADLAEMSFPAPVITIDLGDVPTYYPAPELVELQYHAAFLAAEVRF